MMTTKAIVHVCEEAPGIGAFKHNYRGRANRSKPERYFQRSRVHDVIGDTCGLGVVPRTAGKEKSLLELLAGPHAKRKGKPLRQLIISAEDVPPDKPDGYYAMVLAQLLKAARKWVKKYAPSCRWTAWAHEDRKHPHVHVIVENWDYTQSKRLNLSPFLLERMQDMDWCSGLGFESGRGSRIQIEAGIRLLQEGKIEAECEYQERIQIQAARKDNVRMSVAAELEAWCQKHGISPDVDEIRIALERDILPNRWRANTRTGKGGLLRQPSVTIDGITVRLNKFPEMRERLPNRDRGQLPLDDCVLNLLLEPALEPLLEPEVEEPEAEEAVVEELVAEESVPAGSAADEPALKETATQETATQETEVKETEIKELVAKESFIQAPVAAKSAIEVAAFETALAETEIAEEVPAKASISKDSIPLPEPSMLKPANDEKVPRTINPTKPKPWRPSKIKLENDKKEPTKGD